jgi:hypothetical protein
MPMMASLTSPGLRFIKKSDVLGTRSGIIDVQTSKVIYKRMDLQQSLSSCKEASHAVAVSATALPFGQPLGCPRACIARKSAEKHLSSVAAVQSESW